MVHPDAKVEKVYFYPKPVDLRKTIDALAGRPRRAGYLSCELGQYFRVYQQASQSSEGFILERNGFCGINSITDHFPDDLVVFKQLIAQMQSKNQSSRRAECTVRSGLSRSFVSASS